MSTSCLCQVAATSSPPSLHHTFSLPFPSTLTLTPFPLIRNNWWQATKRPQTRAGTLFSVKNQKLEIEGKFTNQKGLSDSLTFKATRKSNYELPTTPPTSAAAAAAAAAAPTSTPSSPARSGSNTNGCHPVFVLRHDSTVSSLLLGYHVSFVPPANEPSRTSTTAGCTCQRGPKHPTGVHILRAVLDFAVASSRFAADSVSKV